MNLHETVVSKATEAGGRLRVRSALNPILWLCAIIGIPSIVSLSWAPQQTPIVGYLLICVVATAVLGFLFLLVFDRDKLQSEEFQLRKQTLEMMESKGDKSALPISVVDVIANPDYPRSLDDKKATSE